MSDLTKLFFVGLGDNPSQMKAESYNQGICPSNAVLAIFDQPPSNVSGIVCIPDDSLYFRCKYSEYTMQQVTTVTLTFVNATLDLVTIAYLSYY